MPRTPPSRQTALPVALRLIRPALRATQRVSPGVAAMMAERIFFTPPRPPARNGVRTFLETGARFELEVDGRRLVGWRWGNGDRRIFLAHGWGSRGGRFRLLAEPLREAGYTVITFDAPGHGNSGRGMSSMPEFARALRAVVDRFGPANAVVAHSMGAAATALAVKGGLPVERLVFIAPPINPADWAAGFAARLGLAPAVVSLLKSRSEARLGIHWEDLDVTAMASRMTTPLLVIHDRQDDTVPWSNGASIAHTWPGARLVTTEGLGHRAILRAPHVMREIVRFVTGEEKALFALEPAEWLDAELFYREGRPATA
ncbi:MAG: alpha/beta fold hydrolase [Gemmatimonadales bacterium]